MKAKVRFIKNHGNFRVGLITEMEHSFADMFMKSGIVELVSVPKFEQKPAKKRRKRKRKTKDAVSSERVADSGSISIS